MEKPSVSAATANRRVHERVTGPFDGRRLGGVLDTPVSIYDISEGGCLIHSTHEQRLHVVFPLEIDLPDVGTITTDVETIYRRPGFGYAVRFVNLTPENAASLRTAVAQLKSQGR